MCKRALKSVLKNIGMCMVGALLLASYTPTAFAGICFIPGNDCRVTPGGEDVDNVVRSETEERLEPYSLCRLSEPITGYDCFSCSNGKWNCDKGCVAGLATSNGCECDNGRFLCNGECKPLTSTGNEVLNKSTCKYECKPGYERVTGLDGCYEKCDLNRGEAHNTTNGRCECPNKGTVCNGKCVSCATGSLDTDTCICEPGVQCEKPKEYLTLNNNDKTCTSVCRDGRYTLKDRYSDSVSDGHSDGYCDTQETDYRCDSPSVARMFVKDVRDNILGGDCQLCPVSGRLKAKNRWRCTVNEQLVENYPDVCFALGYTYTTNMVDSCTSPFIQITDANLSAYDRAVQKLQRDLPNKYEQIFKGGLSEACPYAPGYYKLGRCWDFDTTHGDAVMLENTGRYTCYECPESVATDGAGSIQGFYHCEHAPCPDGKEWDEERQVCDTPRCSSGFKNLDPIDLCNDAHSCGLPDAYSLVRQDTLSDGTSMRCQADPEAIYTSSQASILRKNGYFCVASHRCSDLYICEPAKPLAMAVRENGGSCESCGSSPTMYQCKINDVPIDTPVDLCNYLGYTIPYADYWKYFAADTHAYCQEMSCGVTVSQYGRPAAGNSFTGQVKCQCDTGYVLTSHGCQKEENPYCRPRNGYSSGYSAEYSSGYSDEYSDCISEPLDPNNICAKSGYIWRGTEPEFSCGLYTLSSCEKCPYGSSYPLYKCRTPNDECVHSTSCWCCLDPLAQGCGGPGPFPSCDSYSASDLYSDLYSNEFMLNCGRERCLSDGYCDTYNPASVGCEKCPYVHSGTTLYKGCRNPQSCAERGYTTPYNENGENVCDPCPENHALGRNCVHKCVASGLSKTPQSCSNGTVSETTVIDGITCYGCGQPPVSPCQTLGYQKLSDSNILMEQSGLIICQHCPYDEAYATCRAVDCDEYPITDARQYIEYGYTCEACPESQKFWRCEEPQPCANKPAVTVTSGCEECTEMWDPSECGCKAKKDVGTYCLKDETCTTALQCGRCTGECQCGGETCAAGQVCESYNSCGNCVSGKCKCPGSTCSTIEKCVDNNDQALALNACGNCPGKCVNKGCKDYDSSYEDDCGSKAVKDTLHPRSDLTCYTCREKVCTDYNANYKTDNKSCPTGYKAEKVTSGVGGLTCYTCKAKTCGDYGYSSSASCTDCYKPTVAHPQTGMTCYECVYDADYCHTPDIYSGDTINDSDSDAISDAISNSGGGSGCADYSCASSGQQYCLSIPIDCGNTSASHCRKCEWSQDTTVAAEKAKDCCSCGKSGGAPNSHVCVATSK